MAKYVIEDTTLNNTANAIREKTGKTDKLTPSNFATEIASIVSGGGSSNFKMEFQTYTPTEDETEHTFTHNLGVVPNFIMIYWGALPNFYGTSATKYSLICCWGVKGESPNISNGNGRYTKQFLSVSSSANSSENAKVSISLDNGIEETTNNGCVIREATTEGFSFKGNAYAHLGASLPYHIILISLEEE